MKLFAALICVFAMSGVASAQVLWIEQSQGDLSNDRLSPTPLALSPGDNLLFGIIAGSDGMGNIDRDYFSITIPPGFELSQLLLDNYASTDFAAFMGIQPGPIFPNDPGSVLPSDLMGWVLFGQSQIGDDLLPQMGTNGYGFTPPLPAGVFSFWVQQTGDYTEWTGNFVVTEVPEPAPLIGLLFVGLARLFRRRGVDRKRAILE